jgi:hypothetical protein
MSINKDNHALVFDQLLPTSSGAITGVIMQLDVSQHAHVGEDVPSKEDAPIAEKKVLIRLKKFIPAVMPPPAFTNKAIPIGIEPGRVPVPALVSILALNLSIVDFGYGLHAVDTVGS